MPLRPVHALGTLALAALFVPRVASAQDLEPTTLPAEVGEVVEPAPEPQVFQLTSGSRLRGTVVSETQDAVTIDADVIGVTTLPTDAIAARLPAGAALGPKPKDPPPPGLFGTTILEGFDKSVSAGVSGREGETSDITYNLAADAFFNGPDRRWRFNSAYFYSKSDGDRTQEEAFANLRRDWKIPDEPPFSFLELRGQYDDFQAWQTRISAFAGVGYALSGDADEGGRYPTVGSERLHLLGRIGAGASYEFGSVNETIPEALIAAEVGYDFTDNAEALLINTLFPDLDEFGESRNTTELSVKVGLSGNDDLGLSLKAGAFNEYLSTTEGDTPHNSLTYFLRLVYDF